VRGGCGIWAGSHLAPPPRDSYRHNPSPSCRCLFPFSVPVVLAVRGPAAMYNLRFIPSTEQFYVFAFQLILSCVTFTAIILALIAESHGDLEDPLRRRIWGYEVAVVVIGAVFQRAAIATKVRACAWQAGWLAGWEGVWCSRWCTSARRITLPPTRPRLRARAEHRPPVAPRRATACPPSIPHCPAVYPLPPACLQYAYLPSKIYDRVMTKRIPFKALQQDQLLVGWANYSEALMQEEVMLAARR